MTWRDTMLDSYSRVWELLEPALAGLSPADLDEMPRPDCNPMGWLAWHIGRIQDSQIADLMGKEQAYIAERWYEKFGRPADPQDTGFGQTPEQVAAFRAPEPKVLLDHYRAVEARTLAYVAGLRDDDLSRELDEPQFQPLPTVGVRLVSIMADDLEHVGQVAYVRGLLQGKGWQKF
ncbi:MAG: DinB family protein [Chloroflexi bacterium]|nr:DinB family protein [Chloroflexota bacterium]